MMRTVQNHSQRSALACNLFMCLRHQFTRVLKGDRETRAGLDLPPRRPPVRGQMVVKTTFVRRS